MRAFITGTGTEIGKTYVTCGLLRHLVAAGQAPLGLKPVMSGYETFAARESDAGLLLCAQGRCVTDAEIASVAPWRFVAPLSPDMAAGQEGRRIDYDALVEFCRVARPNGVLLIEGVGGVMVPLDERHTMLDWMADLGLKVVLVAGSYLGSISHTLTALSVMRARGLQVAVTVVNETPGSTVDIDLASATIAKHGQTPVVCLMRCSKGDAAFASIARLIA